MNLLHEYQYFYALVKAGVWADMLMMIHGKIGPFSIKLLFEVMILISELPYFWKFRVNNPLVVPSVLVETFRTMP